MVILQFFFIALDEIIYFLTIMKEIMDKLLDIHRNNSGFFILIYILSLHTLNRVIPVQWFIDFEFFMHQIMSQFFNLDYSS